MEIKHSTTTNWVFECKSLQKHIWNMNRETQPTPIPKDRLTFSSKTTSAARTSSKRYPIIMSNRQPTANTIETPELLS
ncbi:MAG: hypothetical protein JRJ00_11070 [Deltaproteobacteria bacterium]|nr:hypothetical protein [Deltaproteobacteria bacterium]